VRVPCELKEKPETCVGENDSDFRKILKSAPESQKNGEKFFMAKAHYL
jgi:hypothetical protein